MDNPFRRKGKPKKVKTIRIQGAHVEGVGDSVTIESLFTATRINTSIPGTTNSFTTYDTQVRETYKKYNGRADFGNQQTRAIIDLRTAFIAGEGISISAENDATAKWVDDFFGERFLNAVKGSEMAGQSLMVLSPKVDDNDDVYVKVTRIPYMLERPFRATYVDPFIKDELEGIEIKEKGLWKKATINNFIYIRTGGDDADTRGPTTRVGILLTDIENYDRALRDMRRNNHVLARITPVFETKTEGEAKSIRAKINEQRWRIGQAFMGTAKFSYVTPEGGAHENLQTEMVSTIKNISSVSGVPVHWLGYTDLMSNRSTAENLYEMIKHATLSERVAWERAAYETIVKAQEIYIDSGGTELPALDNTFQVKLPLIDFSKFKERVEALSKAFTDDAISMADYRNMLPGIDPLKTQRAVEAESEEAMQRLVKSGLTLPRSGDDENGEEEE
jgi:hypothetical protein